MILGLAVSFVLTQAQVGVSGSSTSQTATIGRASVKKSHRIYPLIHTLHPGSKGGEVMTLQEKLKSLGVYSGQITGYFGPLTTKAARDFQKSKGLPATGIVGSLTRKALRETMPPPPPVTLEKLDLVDLRLRILDQYPGFEFCDPDFYPIARWDEKQRAVELFPQIRSDSLTMDVILVHLKLNGVKEFSDEQKLAIYREYKKLRAIRLEVVEGTQYINNTRYHFSIFYSTSSIIGDYKTNTRNAEGTITLDREISVSKDQEAYLNCPICLSGETQIDTPKGLIAVRDMRLGMLVWTLDARGHRVATIIRETGKTSFLSLPAMIHLTLEDGRRLTVSPSHRLADGRPIGSLSVGDEVENSRVSSLKLISNEEGATYDILPSGGTGKYWANGILLQSTLK